MDEEKPTSLGRLGVRVAGAVLLYVLSTGPACCLVEKVPRTRTALLVIYRPLGWVMDRVGVPPFFPEYLHWWERLAGAEESPL